MRVHILTPMMIPDAVPIAGEAEAVDYLNDWIGKRHCGRPTVSVLDAGCGDRCALAYGADAVVTGIDVSAALLARNPRLDHRIVSDLVSANVDQASYDTVVCWDVLEHVEHASAALDRLEHALATPGTLILKTPNLRSLKGIATKYTPYRFHRWVYRRFAVSTSMPFPTQFDRSVAPGALISWAASRGLRLEWAAYWESPLQARLRARLHLEGAAWNLASGSVRKLSAGSLDAVATDFVLLFERPGS